MTVSDVVPSAIPDESPALPALSADDIAGARSFVNASRAASTQRAYAADWCRFCHWCQARGAPALPANPALVAVYLSVLSRRGLAPPSVGRALAAIAHAHKRAGVVPHTGPRAARSSPSSSGHPLLARGCARQEACRRRHVVMQLLWSITGDSLAALRDRALIAFGMALAARRSKLVALNLAWEPKGCRVTIRRSKTDQEDEGAVLAVPEGRRLTPLAHLRAWLAAARYAGHSLRAGFVTAAARAGADVWKIQQVSRHKSMQVLSGYVRDARLFDDHAGEPFL